MSNRHSFLKFVTALSTAVEAARAQHNEYERQSNGFGLTAADYSGPLRGELAILTGDFNMLKVFQQFRTPAQLRSTSNQRSLCLQLSGIMQRVGKLAEGSLTTQWLNELLEDSSIDFWDVVQSSDAWGFAESYFAEAIETATHEVFKLDVDQRIESVRVTPMGEGGSISFIVEVEHQVAGASQVRSGRVPLFLTCTEFGCFDDTVSLAQAGSYLQQKAQQLRECVLEAARRPAA